MDRHSSHSAFSAPKIHRSYSRRLSLSSLLLTLHIQRLVVYRRGFSLPTCRRGLTAMVFLMLYPRVDSIWSSNHHVFVGWLWVMIFTAGVFPYHSSSRLDIPELVSCNSLFKDMILARWTIAWAHGSLWWLSCHIVKVSVWDIPTIFLVLSPLHWSHSASLGATLKVCDVFSTWKATLPFTLQGYSLCCGDVRWVFIAILVFMQRTVPMPV